MRPYFGHLLLPLLLLVLFGVGSKVPSTRKVSFRGSGEVQHHDMRPMCYKEPQYNCVAPSVIWHTPSSLQQTHDRLQQGQRVCPAEPQLPLSAYARSAWTLASMCSVLPLPRMVSGTHKTCRLSDHLLFLMTAQLHDRQTSVANLKSSKQQSNQLWPFCARGSEWQSMVPSLAWTSQGQLVESEQNDQGQHVSLLLSFAPSLNNNSNLCPTFSRLTTYSCAKQQQHMIAKSYRLTSLTAIIAHLRTTYLSPEFLYQLVKVRLSPLQLLQSSALRAAGQHQQTYCQSQNCTVSYLLNRGTVTARTVPHVTNTATAADDVASSTTTDDVQYWKNLTVLVAIVSVLLLCASFAHIAMCWKTNLDLQAALQQQIQTVQTMTTSHSQQMEHLLGIGQPQAVTKLNQELEHKDLEIKSLQQDQTINDLNARIRAQDEHAKSQNFLLHGALAALTAAEEREQALQLKVTDLENKVQHLEEKCKQKDKSVNRFSTGCAAFRTQLEAAWLIILSLKHDLLGFIKKVKGLESDIARKDQVIKYFESRAADFEQLSDMEQELFGQRAQVVSLTRDRDSKARHNAALLVTVKQLTATLKKMASNGHGGLPADGNILKDLSTGFAPSSNSNNNGGAHK